MPTISLGQALRNAIESEDAAKRFYTLLAESTSDEETSAAPALLDSREESAEGGER